MKLIIDRSLDDQLLSSKVKELGRDSISRSCKPRVYLLVYELREISLTVNYEMQ